MTRLDLVEAEKWDGRHSEVLPQALKGLLAALGAGSGLTRSVAPVHTTFLEDWEDVWSSPLLEVVGAADHGAIVTVASKVVARLQHRVVRSEILSAVVLSGASQEEIVLALRKLGVDADVRDALMIDGGGDLSIYEG